MKHFKVYYSIKGKRFSVIVRAETGFDAQEHVREFYGPCKIIGIEYLD